MLNFKRSAPQIPVVLASLVIWASFAWGMPAEAPATEGEAEAAAEDPWAGVRMSDAYDELRCTYCWGYNELTAARCPSCGHDFLLPSGEYTYPPWVFVPGKGYYREGTVLEPGKTRKGYWIAGIVLAAAGPTALLIAGYSSPESSQIITYFACLAAIGVGAGLIIYGLIARTKPVYALDAGERFEPYGGVAYARRPRDSDGVALKIEITLLGF